MQTTANLWDVLCRDLESQRQVPTPEKHVLAARKFKEAALQVFAAGSPRLCDALEIAGDVCQAAGYYEDAVVDFRESLDRNRNAGYLAPAARVATKLALLTEHEGDADAAADYYRQAVDLYDSVGDHSQHGMLLGNLASLERGRGNFEKAESHYLKAIATAAGIHGQTHPEVAQLYSNLGVAYTDAGLWSKAENMHLRALGIREHIYGPMHPEVAHSLSNLGVLYHLSGEFGKAASFYKAAIETYTPFEKPGDQECNAIRANLEKLPCPTPKPRAS